MRSERLFIAIQSCMLGGGALGNCGEKLARDMGMDG